MTTLVDYRRHGPLAEISLNRPDKLNAINAAMRDELRASFDRAAADDSVRAVLLRGKGRAFSTGFDLDIGQPLEGESRADFLRRELRLDYSAIMHCRAHRNPVIAVVHGYCLGSSMELSAVCDLTIAAEGCRFGAPEVRFGSGMVCLILPWIVGQKAARELLLTGSDRIDAERAAAIGLVNKVVPEDRLLAEARSIALEIAGNDPYAVRMTKRALNESLDSAGLPEALEAALRVDMEIEIHESPESKEFDRILERDGPKAALAWRAELHRSGNEH